MSLLSIFTTGIECTCLYKITSAEQAEDLLQLLCGRALASCDRDSSDGDLS